MSSLSISQNGAGGSAYQAIPILQINNAFVQLAQSLASNDLSTAKKAYATIQSLQPAGIQNQANSYQQNFRTLGHALQSGSAADARKAFVALLNQNQTGAPPAAAPAPTAPAANSTYSVDISI